jgi:hypothetical protein
MKIRISGSGAPEGVVVENAETGEVIQGVLALRIHTAAGHAPEATLILNDFEIDNLVVEAEAE